MKENRQDKGGGKTPPMVVELLKKAVAEKSQSAVARETGLTLLTVQRYLQGIGEPRDKNLKRLSDYFGVSISVLRGEGGFTPIAFDSTYSEPIYMFERHYWRLLTTFYSVFKEGSTDGENFFTVRTAYELAVITLQYIDNIWNNLKLSKEVNDISTVPVEEIEDYAKSILEPLYLQVHVDNTSENKRNSFQSAAIEHLKTSSPDDYAKTLLTLYAKATIAKYYEILENCDIAEIEFFYSFCKTRLTQDEIDIYNRRLSQKNQKQQTQRKAPKKKAKP